MHLEKLRWQRWKKEKNEKKTVKKKRYAARRDARLAARGSNCVINLKVRFFVEKERELGGKRKEDIEKMEKREKERERGECDIRKLLVGLCCRVCVFFRGTVYTCKTTVRIRNCRWTTTGFTRGGTRWETMDKISLVLLRRIDSRPSNWTSDVKK